MNQFQIYTQQRLHLDSDHALIIRISDLFRLSAHDGSMRVLDSNKVVNDDFLVKSVNKLPQTKYQDEFVKIDVEGNNVTCIYTNQNL